MELENEARFGLDEVRILIALSERVDLHLVAAHLAREPAEILCGCDDLQRGARVGSIPSRNRHDGGSYCDDVLHDCNPSNDAKTYARHVRRSRRGTGTGIR